jgi:hypothetical protein
MSSSEHSKTGHRPNSGSSGHGQSSEQSIEQSCALIERTLGGSPAYKKVDAGLYVVKQGSSYVMINVLPSGARKDRALVRVTAQVVSGVRPEPSLFRQLLILNGTLRFGAFAYVPEGEIVLFTHSLLGGPTLDSGELLAAVHDVAVVADGYDDRIVARYGGRRMEDVILEEALTHLFNEKGQPHGAPGHEDMPHLPEPHAEDAPEAHAEGEAPAKRRPTSGQGQGRAKKKGHDT